MQVYFKPCKSSVTGISSCPRCTALMSSSVTYIIWTRWRTHAIPTIQKGSRTRSAPQHDSLLGNRRDDPTEQPRWGKIGKQKIEDAGPLCPERMETVDDEILSNALKFADKAKQDGKPFFIWLNPIRMHVVTHLSEKYQKMRTARMASPSRKLGRHSSIILSARS